ncbi:MAG: kelch repeat-containing protein [Ginsengibacter sp.]
MKRIFLPLILICMLPTLHLVAQKPSICVSWKRIAILPPVASNQKSLGIAGAINGVTNNVFIVAGGSNFPGRLPWEGGKKNYYDQIFVLQKKGDDFEWNRNVKTNLPEAIAYCGVTSTDKGIVYAGGENQNGISNKCFLLNWNGEKEEVEVKPLPDLPLPLTNLALTHTGNLVFAAGGDMNSSSSNSFFCLDLKEKDLHWKKLPDLPVALANSTVIAQNGPSGKEIFVIGGRSKTPSGISDLHNTTFAFDLKKNKWRKCADISDGVHTSNLSAASGMAIGENYILVTGGDNGKVFHKIETLIAEIANAGSPEEKTKLTEEKNNLSIHHKGFDKSLLLYSTNSNAWTKIGELPFPAHVTTTDVKWGNDIVVSNGEIKPGIRTPDVMLGKIITKK